MPVTVIFGDRSPRAVDARSEGANLWLDTAALSAATGWELKPEGACKGGVCVPIPPGRDAEFLRNNRRSFNLAAFARLLGQPAVHDDKHSAWFFGEAAATRRSTIASLEAPDFELPDLDGKLHRLSDYRGKKVLLSAWASW